MYMGCENDMERDAWLYVMKTVLRSCKDEHFSPFYDHVWDVKLLKTGLAGKQGLLQGGNYRLCFSDCSLFLCPLFASQNSLKIIEFPLICISNFGLSYEHELYLRVGRSAITGPGQIWIVHDEAIVLNDIHNILSNIATFQNSRGRAKTMPGDIPATRPNSSRTESGSKTYARCSSASSIPVDSPYQLTGSLNENSNHSLKELASVDEG
uniref:Insulin receptor substrate 1 n=1 Tax=Romanomermis culicivorax TaxID=13658 RepID=A0A915JL91_ROMCU